MEKFAEQIIYRTLTNADFFNIYNRPRALKPGEKPGGKQSYIDIPTKAVPLEDWRQFFSGSKPEIQSGRPVWSVNIHSLGLEVEGSQLIDVGLRREASVNIRSQKLHSRLSKRIFSWHPEYGDFPAPKGQIDSASDPKIEALVGNLVIYLIRTTEAEYWAGWINQFSPPPDLNEEDALANIFPNTGSPDGIIKLSEPIRFESTKTNWPFLDKGEFRELEAETYTSEPIRAKPAVRKAPAKKQLSTSHHVHQPEEKLISNLFDEDIGSDNPKIRERVVKTIVRNRKSVAELKALYNTCQITGNEFIFLKRDGSPYLEAHHLEPLAKGGADSPANLVVLSPLVHKMLHYADVTGLDLDNIKDDKLSIQINGKDYTITWHPAHAAIISKFDES
ncbi:HNH endonuclease [Hellea sp.]|nr:HNH endonuclease [Hellea sp.]